MLKNSNGTVDTCDALFHQENIVILEYSGIRSVPEAITAQALGFELDSTGLRFDYSQSNN